jgi:phospholipid-translocating ATPase
MSPPSALPSHTFPSNQPPRPSIVGASNDPRMPQTRNRRFSLHRALFAKSAKSLPQGTAEAIELTAPSDASTRASPEKHGKDMLTQVRHTSTEDKLARKVRVARIWEFGEGLYTRARKTVLRIPDISPSADGRHIFINTANTVDERTQSPYVHNSIRSSRYSLFSFFPRQFIAQFSKLANAYFLAISIMQLIPGLSTTGQFTTIVPLLLFISISMAKEGWDDIRRWKLDKEENSRSTRVLDMGAHANRPIQRDLVAGT